MVRRAAWYNGHMTDQTQITLTAPRSVDMALIVGPADETLRLVQDSFQARITVRGDAIVLEGDPIEVQSLTALFSDLIKLVEDGGEPTCDYVRRAIDLLRTAEFSPQTLREDILLTYRGRAIRPKTAGQKRYVDAVREHTVTFGIGPAGTGKTYLAMAMAVAALKRKEVGRIILTRPVVEAGESLGFLPGTLAEKVDPYIRPLYDALFDMTDMERANQLIDSGVIEIAPLAFMRGRTLNDSFIILDEAQNTTPEQMKMFLTRLGFGSKMVVTGDATQLDLPRGVSGLKGVRDVLDGIDGIAFCELSGKDVVRHSLVAAIVAAYDQASRKA
ncbi:PhoH-like protein [Coriobacteriaceae bacterium CHKCI002]|nr:PhoH-like protein [Coriobacteriaceae bacterium CHKCI002]